MQLTTACASVEDLLGHHRQTHARLETTLIELQDPNSAEAVALMIELAANGVWRREYDALHSQAILLISGDGRA